MPIRVSNVVVIYFVIGAVMFGGGAIAWNEAGLASYFIDAGPDGASPADSPSEELGAVEGAITSLIGSFGGPTLLVWNLFSGLVKFLHWPLFVFIDNDAPARVIVLLGGAPTVMFYVAVIRLVRTSA